MSIDQDRFQAAVAELLDAPPRVHLEGSESWALERQVLGWLATTLQGQWRTVETGCGSSSIVFMLAGTDHTIVAPNASEHQTTREWCATRGFSTDRTTSIVEDSTKALPSLQGPFDLGLVDGGHAFPLPFVDWLYIAQRLRIGGLVIIDDINLPTCGTLHAFLDAEQGRWERVQLFERTSVFRKMSDVVVSPHDWTGQPWVLAELARKRPLSARISQRLSRALVRTSRSTSRS
jgi:predicted O-methyltransferase YrrM